MGATMDRPAKDIRPGQILSGLAEIGACVGVSTLLAAGCTELKIAGQFQMFLPAIVLCCWLRGFAGAVAAALLSAVVLWCFFMPPHGFGLPTARDAAHLAVFLGVAVFVCRIVTRERRTNDQLMQENFELGYKVFLMREIRRR
jgi:K+-sensing histidine kinase KdpD